MYGGEGQDDQEQLRALYEERRQIVDKYDLGREDGAVIDDWEDPKLEIYHKTDRFGFITDSRLPDTLYRTEKQQKQLEKEISRLPKWLKMKEEKHKWFPVGSKYYDKMVERVWKGVPERLRGSLWATLLDLDRIKQEQFGKYQEMKELARKYSPDIRQIDLDVNRTYRDHVMFRERYNSRQQDLFHVLAAYSMFNTEVGYCQGMSQIAALLLMYLNSDEDAFWALSQIMSCPKYNMHGFFIPGFPKLIRFQDHHDKILHKKLRRLQKHLISQNITTGLYTLKWFFQCFLDRLPFSLSIRIWDLYLLEGESIMFATAFTILRMHRKTLLKMQMDELIEFLQKTLAEDFLFEDDYVIETALRENLQELRSSRLHSAGPPPDAELPQKPFGLVDISQQELNVVMGARTPVAEEEKELHRNSMKRELDTLLKLASQTSENSFINESCESIETPLMNRKRVNDDSEQKGSKAVDSMVHLMSEVALDNGDGDDHNVPPSNHDLHHVGVRPNSHEVRLETDQRQNQTNCDKRRSAAADLAQFRLESSSTSIPINSSHTRSSSLLQDSSTTTTTRSSSITQETSKSSITQDTSKSSNYHNGRRSQSRTSRLSSRTSSRLDTTGSSGVLNSSYEDSHNRSAPEARSSYYFGEAPDFKDILNNVKNGNGSCRIDSTNCDIVDGEDKTHHGLISPHTGEVVRIRVPFSGEDSSLGEQCLSAENIQRLVDQQISPSYNGHKVTIKVNRSNETISTSTSAKAKVSYPEKGLSNIKHRTSSVQNIPPPKTSRNSHRDRSNSGNGGLRREYSSETFF